jgi:hypothetical protein
MGADFALRLPHRLLHLFADFLVVLPKFLLRFHGLALGGLNLRPHMVEFIL